MVLDLSDHETKQAYLAQSHETVAGRRHANRSAARLHEALRKMRKQLQPMFDARAKRFEAERAKSKPKS